MKKIKVVPLLLMLLLCLGVFGLGVYTASVTKNSITSNIIVNSANANINLEVAYLDLETFEPVEVGADEGRKQTKVALMGEHAIKFNETASAFYASDVAPKYYGITISTTSPGRFIVDSETIEVLNGKTVEASPKLVEGAVIVTKNHMVKDVGNPIDEETGFPYFDNETPYMILLKVQLGVLMDVAFTVQMDLAFNVHKLEDWVEMGNYGINGVHYLHYGNYPQTLEKTFDVNQPITGYTRVDGATFEGYDVKLRQFVGREVYTKDGETNGTKYVLLTYETKWFASTVVAKECKKLFKIEPLKWRILARNELSGHLKLMCDTVVEGIDYQRYTKEDSFTLGGQTYDGMFAHDGNGNILEEGGEPAYAANYNVSTLRTYLTETFYTNAFNVSEELLVLEELVDNSAGSSWEGCQDTYDKVYSLSISDVTNTDYGFINALMDEEDLQKAIKASDYAVHTGTTVITKDILLELFGTTNKNTIIAMLMESAGMTKAMAELMYERVFCGGTAWLRTANTKVDGYALVMGMASPFVSVCDPETGIGCNPAMAISLGGIFDFIDPDDLEGI